jgi:hypothetical protein
MFHLLLPPVVQLMNANFSLSSQLYNLRKKCVWRMTGGSTETCPEHTSHEYCHKIPWFH